MNKTIGNSSALKSEKDLIRFKKNKNFKSSKSDSNAQLKSQSSILPRSGWQDRRALLKVLIRAKKSLEIAEITAFLD